MPTPDDLDFVELETVSLGEGYLSAAGDDLAAFGTPNGRIEVASVDERRELHVDRPLDALAVGRYVFVTAGDEVRAYATSGVQLWSVTVDDADVVELVTFGDRGLLGGLTADGRLLGLDVEDGREVFSVDRVHGDVDRLGAVVGGNGRVFVAAWSFLTAYDADGTLVYDCNLDGAITTAAVVDDGVVAGMKDGRLVRLESDGETRWSEPLGVGTVAAVGDGVLATTADGLVVVDEHGNADPLQVPAADRLSATADGTVVGLGTGGRVTLYRNGDESVDALSADVLTDSVGADDPIRVRVTNDGASPVETPLDVTATDGVDVATHTGVVALDADETREVAVRVTDVRSEGPVDIEVLADGEQLATERIDVVARPDPGTFLSASGSVAAFVDGAVEIAVDVRNDSDAVDASVRLADGDDQSVDAGTMATLRDRRAFAPGSTHSVAVQARAADERTELTASITVPADPVSLRVLAAGTRSQPFLDVVVDNRADARVVDTLHVGDERDLPDIERDVDLGPSGRLRVVVPLTSGFVADGLDPTARLDGLAVDAAATLSAQAWTSDAEWDAVWDDEEPTPDDRVQGLEVERSVPEQAPAGATFEERLAVTNRSETVAADVRLVVDDERVSLGDIRPGETHDLTRSHAVFEPGDLTVDGGDVSTADTDVPVGSASISITPSEFRTLAALERHDDGVVARLTFENDGDRPVSVPKFGVDVGGGEVWEPNTPLSVPDGDSETVERRVGETDVEESSTHETIVSYRRDGDEEIHRTLATVSDVTTSTPEESVDATGPPVAVSVTDRTVAVVDSMSSVELVVRNESASTLRTLRLDADGDAVTTTPLSEDVRRVDQLGIGDTVTHLVDVEPTGESTSFTLQVSGSTGTGEFSTTYTVGGPVAPTREEWTGDHVAQWTVTSADGESDDDGTDANAGDDHPAHLVTSYRRD